MKTPRELLLERHRHAQSKLDQIRREALASAKETKPECEALSLRDIFRSLRWHLAGLSAVWVFVLFLHLDTGRTPQMMATIPPVKTLPRQFIMVSVRENRRQLTEMIGFRPDENQHRELLPSKPRSARREEILIA